jgi:hypothetical protein
MKDAGDLFADAAGCAGDESLAARQIEHGWFPLLEQIANRRQQIGEEQS